MVYFEELHICWC